MLLSRCEKGFSCLPDNKAQCFHSLPNGVQVNMSDYILLGGTYLRANSKTLEMHKQAKLRDYGDSKIVSTTEIKMPSQANLANAVASYCVLHWCVKTYSATVRSHTLFENSDTWHDANAQINEIQPGESRLDLQPPREDDLTQFSFPISGWASSTIGGWLKDKMEISNVPNTHCYRDRAGMGSSMDILTKFLLPMLRSNLTDIFESLANGMTARVRQLRWSAQRYAKCWFWFSRGYWSGQWHVIHHGNPDLRQMGMGYTSLLATHFDYGFSWNHYL